MRERPYHFYYVWSFQPSWRELSDSKRSLLKDKLADWLKFQDDVQIITYLSLGMPGGSTMIWWARCKRPEEVQPLLAELASSEFGKYLTLDKTLFGIKRRSQYSRPGQVSDQEVTFDGSQQRLPYLIIYPFTKTNAWYQLDFDKRRELMKAHIKVGLGHPEIRQCLLYSYGIDNDEFIVSYETASLEDFQDLVMELRSTAVRTYTANDLPVYAAVYRPLDEQLALI